MPLPFSHWLQWLGRAREALKREVSDIQQQHGQLAAGLTSAVAAAAAAPASPQKALAAQLLSGLQSSMQHEVGKELRALQLADSLLGSVAQQFRGAPPGTGTGSPPRGGDASAAAAAAVAGSEAPAPAQASSCKAECGPGSAAESSKAVAAAGSQAEDAAGSWTIPAMPAGARASYPRAPSSQQVVASAADGALAQLQQLAGSEAQLAQTLALAAASSGGGSGSGGGGSSSSLRSTFGQMQQMLHSVCQLLQQDELQDAQRASEPGGAGVGLPANDV